MNITNDCVTCIVGQINKATKLLECSEELAKNINTKVLNDSKDFSFEKTPPHVAKDVYQYLAKMTGLKDPLEKLKQESIENALTYVPIIEENIKNSKDKLFAAIKGAVAGNVIDFATTKTFSLKDEINNVFDTPFSIDYYEEFKSKLESIDEFMILADNAGENVFDKILAKTIKEIYPNKKIYYATRGEAIINDITTKEAFQVGIDKYCEVISSGVDTPGLEKCRADKDFLELYESMPLVLSKGMGNFECLESYKDNRVFFLFKVKCDVVANKIERNLGEIVLMKNH